MSTGLWIPPATRERLANPAPPGQRHHQIVQVAASLTAQGMNPEAVFYQIRPMYGPDISDAEIRAVIRWADRIPRRVNFPTSRFSARKNPPEKGRFDFRPVKAAVETAEKAVKCFLGGFSCTDADLWEASPFRLFDAVETDALTLISAVYRPGELINIVAEFAETAGKARPTGYGKTRERNEWLSFLRENGPVASRAGAWIRPNPTDGNGISDANVADFRFCLLEFDSIPLDLQLPFFARLPLPISAIITSGGKSLHAWVKIAAENAGDYREAVSRIFSALAPFEIDAANRNPARLSRLPGISREIGGAGDKRQRLLYLNPAPDYRRIFE